MLRCLLLALACFPALAQDAVTVVERRELPAEGAPPGSHRLALTLAYLDGAGWKPEAIQAAALEAGRIFAQCGVALDRAELVRIQAPERYLDFLTPLARELARAVPLRRPAIWFVRDTRQRPAFDAEAIGRGNSRSRPELADTVWVTRGTRDLEVALAHELAHVLMDSGEHSNEPGNLMRDETAPEHTRLSQEQCDRLTSRATANGLLRQAGGQSPAQGAIRLPLDAPTGWQVLEYRNIPPHQVRFSAAGLEMRVERSAMPVIYPLPKPAAVRAIRVKGRVQGSLAVPPGRQGEEKLDDYVFRIGLVESGTRTLNFLQRQVAAAWVRKLFELAPKDGGISRILFFNVGADAAQIGRRRQHPLSELIHEQVVAVSRPDGTFEFEHALDQPLETLAVWLSSDGDDTGSTFAVLVEEIALLPVLDTARQRSRP